LPFSFIACLKLSSNTLFFGEFALCSPEAKAKPGSVAAAPKTAVVLKKSRRCMEIALKRKFRLPQSLKARILRKFYLNKSKIKVLTCIMAPKISKE